MKRSLFLFAVLLASAACNNAPEAAIADIQGIDSSIKPGNNFFMFVNHTWYAADIGGVAIAYGAFKMTKEGRDTTKIAVYTPDQRFFISVARIWRVKMKDEFLRPLDQ